MLSIDGVMAHDIQSNVKLLHYCFVWYLLSTGFVLVTVAWKAFVIKKKKNTDPEDRGVTVTEAGQKTADNGARNGHHA